MRSVFNQSERNVTNERYDKPFKTLLNKKMTYTSIINKIGIATERLEQIPPVKLDHKIQWTGLTGVAQGIFSQNKFEKLAKTKIIDDINYLNMPSFLIKCAKSLEQILLDEKSGDDSNGKMSQKAVNLIVACYDKWLSVCPGIDQMTIEENEIAKDVTISLGVASKFYIYQSFLKFNLQEDSRKEVEKDFDLIKWRINRLKEKSGRDSNSGCFSIVIGLLISSTILYSLL